MDWVYYSLIAAVGFGIIPLLLTYLSHNKISPLIIGAWFWSLTALLFIVSSLLTARKELKIPNSSIKWFVLLAIVAVITNYFSVKALQVGPNTGLVRSIQASAVIVATAGAYYFFHETVSVRAGIGVGLIILGIILIVNK